MLSTLIPGELSNFGSPHALASVCSVFPYGSLPSPRVTVEEIKWGPGVVIGLLTYRLNLLLTDPSEGDSASRS